MYIQHSSIILLFIFLIFPFSHCDDDDQFTECSTKRYDCGPDLQRIGYPFWGDDRPEYCGHRGFELKCQSNSYATINIGEHTFRVLEINYSSYTMTIARLDLWEDHCPRNFSNITLTDPLFRYAPSVRMLNIFYGCVNDVPFEPRGNNFTCDPIEGFRGNGGFYVDESISRGRAENLSCHCEVGIEVPVLRTSLDRLWNREVTLQDTLRMGFQVDYYADSGDCRGCEASGGICGSDSETKRFVCLCRDKPHSLTCQGNSLNLGRKIGIGFGAAGFGIVLMCLVFYFYQRRNKKRAAASSWESREISYYPSSMSDLEKSGLYMGVQMFNYIELEEATNRFDSKKELGDGGFGTVYKGKLKDGRIVAVKRLYENNFKRVEQFMNEVEILTRLRHQNLVTLYGCTSRHCRELLLVYEYVPNGTLADHLHGERGKPGSLPWTTRMSIAVETASALAYLHASDVVHRDVKTNNILLDNNFSVKVADFGLSRLFPMNVTHVSTAPQGTPGYVDPEYHECYQLTDKSDVYSFGVVLVELISSKPAVDITRHRHEINLSNMAINKIQSCMLHELVDPNLGFESDHKVKSMITKVAELAFQCLQGGKDMRPSMEEVFKTLTEIQIAGKDRKNKDEEDKPKESVVLLKNDTMTLSPDSVSTSWTSTTTTPNVSQ